MTEQMLIVFGVLAGAVGLFAWGRPRVDIVAVLVLLALMLSRVLTPQESLAGFGDPVVILIAAVFIVSGALVNTGVAHRLAEAVLKAGRGSETRLIVLIMALAGGIGAFMSSSAIVAMFIPVVLAVADKAGLNRKRMLMPLSIAALISGMMTLIASSPNMIIDNTLRARGLAPLSFFSWTPFGLAVLATGIAFILMERRVLSKQLTAVDATTTSPGAYDLVASYGLADRWHRLRVPAGSPLINWAVGQTRHLYDRLGVILVGFERHPHGRTEFLPALPESVFETNDAIFVIADAGQMQQLIETQQLTKLARLDERQRSAALQELGPAEVMLAPESKLIGKTLGELEFRSRYHLTVLAIRHRGQPLTTNLANQTLDFGDTLLVAGGWADIGQLQDDRENFLILTLPAEYRDRFPARRRAPVAIGILIAMVVVMALELIPNSAAALLAALAMIASGCIRLDSIYRIISWKTVVLIAGMLPLATALTKTGATVLMANGLVTALGSLGRIPC
jgi:di/tricarboxylate transporter